MCVCVCVCVCAGGGGGGVGVVYVVFFILFYEQIHDYTALCKIS